MKDELEGRVALVTGAAMGIGRAAAQALADRGAMVVLVDRQEAEPLPNGASQSIVADVSDGAAVASAVEQAVADNGRLDILVNAAGIQRYGSVVDTSEDTWNEVIATNLTSVFHTTRHAVPHLAATGDGAIVNVASVQAFVSQRGVAAYTASKGALVALTNALAIDHAPEVRANAVAPGSTDTPMLRTAAAGFSDDPDTMVGEWGKMHPLQRVATAAEVGEVIAFLAGPRASFVTGTCVRVDGGLLSQLGGT
jgi:NAD(P)-dependent dehydrogenase (short-subunit alcohol dehydrogenase family)